MLTPEQIAYGWIEHDGGPMPLRFAAKKYMIVEVLSDSGARQSNYADLFTWRSSPNKPNIIAYRPVPHD